MAAANPQGPAPTGSLTPSGARLASRIDSLLPQTQCTQCGFDGCLPYAQAIAAGQAQINRCPPGGRQGIARLAALLGKPEIDLDASCGQEGPLRLARIDEQACIGCTKCIVACPVDAIIGARKRMHTVIPELCTGCGLCLPPCPVDCIVLAPSPDHPHWSDDDARKARIRFGQRHTRLERDRADEEQRLQQLASKKLTRPDTEPADAHAVRKRAVIAAAIERARAIGARR